MTDANTAIDFSKGYVGDLGVKIPTKVASMINIDLEGEQTLNGIPVVENDIVLVNAQTDQTENGVYIVSTGEWNRAVWFNNGLNAVPGTIVMAYFGGGSGSSGPRTLWSLSCPDNPINFGTSLIAFDFFAFASNPGVFLLSSNNLSDVQSAATSRTNLGLAIGTNVQAQNANLQSIAGLTFAANKIIGSSAANTAVLLDLGSASGNVPKVGTQSATTSLAGLGYLSSPITIANNSGSPNTTINFSGGIFQFSDGSGQAVGNAWTKTTAAWSAGNNGGGLDTGSIAANTWYHCYAIANLTNPAVPVTDYLFSINPTSPTLPVGYTKYQRIKQGQFFTDGSTNIISFFTDGESTYFTTVRQAYNVTNPGTAAVLRTLPVPSGLKVYPIAVYYYGQNVPGGANYQFISSPDQTDSVPSTAAFTNIVSSGDSTSISNIRVRTNTSSQVRTRVSASDGGTAIQCIIFGWSEGIN